MKALFKLLTVPAVAGVLVLATPHAARADHRKYRSDRDNGAAVAIVAGIATVGLIAALACGQERAYDRAYNPPPPPPPPPQRWVPGHYETRRDRVVVPGYWETVVTPAEYGWVRRGHRWEYALVKPERRQRVWVPERYEWRETQVWVPGRFEVAYRR